MLVILAFRHDQVGRRSLTAHLLLLGRRTIELTPPVALAAIAASAMRRATLEDGLDVGEARFLGLPDAFPLHLYSILDIAGISISF